MASTTLQHAKMAKEDEFYTQITDIERELKYYKPFFKDKVIFCNCDDPEWSNFWRYFQLNFYELELKKLVSTHYEDDIPSYRMDIISTDKGDQTGLPDYVKTPLRQNGDFRSPECIEIMREADIIVTNPPFSLFRQYIALLVENNKKFVVIGNQNCVSYKEIFPLIQDNKIWLGYYNGNMEFRVPDYYEPRVSRYWVDENGKKWRSMGNICWFTNLDIPKRHENLILYKTYIPEEYPHYDNFDGIDVGAIRDIPIDYDGVMGVPITFLNYYNPEQFIIVGMGTGDNAKKIGITKNYRGRTDLAYTTVDGKQKCPYNRILIKHKR